MTFVLRTSVMIGCLLAVTCSLVSEMLGQADDWEKADEATVRLEPKVFTLLPRVVIEYLDRRGCTIPQAFHTREPHNVIQGQFRKAGQVDWAVLCSKNRVSSILVFWNGKTHRIDDIASVDDRNFLQVVGAGKIGFSRSIGTVDSKYILQRNKLDGIGRWPASITHHGINDAFVEKASTVRYFFRNRWLELQGAD